MNDVKALVKQHIIYLHLSGEKGCAEAQFMIAYYYKNGIFLEKNRRKYFDWLLEAAGNKHRGAILEMAELHSVGCPELKIQENQEKAKFWEKELEK